MQKEGVKLPTTKNESLLRDEHGTQKLRKERRTFCAYYLCMAATIYVC